MEPFAGQLPAIPAASAASRLSYPEQESQQPQCEHDEQEILCQLHDQGQIADPLAGRVRRDPESRGHGLFLVNQVCDLVELRTGRAGTTVRLHMRLQPP